MRIPSRNKTSVEIQNEEDSLHRQGLGSGRESAVRFSSLHYYPRRGCPMLPLMPVQSWRALYSQWSATAGPCTFSEPSESLTCPHPRKHSDLLLWNWLWFLFPGLIYLMISISRVLDLIFPLGLCFRLLPSQITTNLVAQNKAFVFLLWGSQMRQVGLF